MTDPWTVHTVEGPNLTAGEFVEILEGHSARTIALWESLTPDQWAAPSRNRDWTAHETARHTTDALEMGLSRILDAPVPFSMDGFDPNSTPATWLAESDGELPSETIDRYGAAASRAQTAVADRMAAEDTSLIQAPYGEAHWATLVVHVLWDSWIHERDIALAAGLPCESTPAELRLVGLYAAVMALVPLRGSDPEVDELLHLGGDIDVTIRAATAGDAIVASEVSEPGGVSGEAAAVIDSLSGRGEPITELLPDISPAMTLFAAYLSS